MAANYQSLSGGCFANASPLSSFVSCGSELATEYQRIEEENSYLYSFCDKKDAVEISALDLFTDDPDLRDMNEHLIVQEQAGLLSSTFNESSELSPHVSPNVSACSDDIGNQDDGLEIGQPNQDGSRNKLLVSRSKGRPSKSAPGNLRPIIQCPICSKTFNNSSALAKHKLIHSDERKYSCTLCSKAFKRQDHLNGHMMTHCTKKPYECRFAGCEKSYCDARSLRRHHENHHQQILDSSTSTGGSDSALTPGLTPCTSSDSQSSMFNFDITTDQSYVVGSDASPLQMMSQKALMSPNTMWTTGYNPLDEPKPVKCSICDRRFRNLPALNGHMRLHGGYSKKQDYEIDEQHEEEDKNPDNPVSYDKNDGLASSPGLMDTRSQVADSGKDPYVVNTRQGMSAEQPSDCRGYPNSGAADYLKQLARSDKRQQRQGRKLNGVGQRSIRGKAKQAAIDEHSMDQTRDMVEGLQLADEGTQKSEWSTGGPRGGGQTMEQQSYMNGGCYQGMIKSEYSTGDQYMPTTGRNNFQYHHQMTLQNMDAPSHVPVDDQQVMQQINMLDDMCPNKSQGLGSFNNYSDASQSSPGLVGSVPGTPNHATFSNTHSLTSKMHKRSMTPSYILSHSHAGNLHRASSAIFSSVNPHSPFPQKSTMGPYTPTHASTNSNYFQFPPRANLNDNPYHPSTPNHPVTPSYGVTQQTPHSPFTSQPKTPYTPNTPSSYQFQYPPAVNQVENSSVVVGASSYSTRHQKVGYHPYCHTPVQPSPRYQQQQEFDDQQQHEHDVMQVDAEIAQRLQMLKQEDMMQQKSSSLMCDGLIGTPSQINDQKLGEQKSMMSYQQGQLQNFTPTNSANFASSDILGCFSQMNGGQYDMDLELNNETYCGSLLNNELPTADSNKQGGNVIDSNSAIQQSYPGFVPPNNATDGTMPCNLPGGDDVVQILLQQSHGLQYNEMIYDPVMNVHNSATARNQHQNYDVPRANSYNGPGCIPTSDKLMDYSLGADLKVENMPENGMSLPGYAAGRNNQFCEPSGIVGFDKPKKKHRPEPLVIPATVNNYRHSYQEQSQKVYVGSAGGQRIPPPYTPPSMISPARGDVGGTFWSVNMDKVPQSAPAYSARL